MIITKEDFFLAIKLIEHELGIPNLLLYLKENRPNNKNYFLAGQSLASALMVVKGFSSELYINDVDIFNFRNDSFAKNTNSKGIIDNSFSTIKTSNISKPFFDEEDIESFVKEDVQFIFENIKNKEKIISYFSGDYYNSEHVKFAVDKAFSLGNKSSSEPLNRQNGSMNNNIIPPNDPQCKKYLKLTLNYLYDEINYHLSNYHKSKKASYRNILSFNTYRSSLKVISSVEIDKINYISYYSPEEKMKKNNCIHFLNNFDFNSIQVGFELTTNTPYFTKNFYQFMLTGDFRITNLNGASHTAVRYFKKLDEYSNYFNKIHFNKELDIKILTQAIKLKDAFYIREHFEDLKLSSVSELKNFSDVYINKIRKDFNNYFTVEKVYSKNNFNLYNLNDKTNDVLDFIDDNSHYRSLLNGFEDQKKELSCQYLPYLISNLSDIAYNKKYMSSKNQKLYFNFNSKKETVFGVKENKNYIRKIKIEEIIKPNLNISFNKEQFDFLCKKLKFPYDTQSYFYGRFFREVSKIPFVKKVEDVIRIHNIIFPKKEDIYDLIGYYEDNSYEVLTEMLHCYTEVNSDNFCYFDKLAIKYNDYRLIFDSIVNKKYEFFNNLKPVNIGNCIFENITTASRLKREGLEMHHCVGGRKTTLSDLRGVFFSVRSNEHSRYRATFDLRVLSPSFLKLGEYRSFYNKNNHLPKHMFDDTLEYIEYLKNTYNVEINVDNLKYYFHFQETA